MSDQAHTLCCYPAHPVKRIAAEVHGNKFVPVFHRQNPPRFAAPDGFPKRLVFCPQIIKLRPVTARFAYLGQRFPQAAVFQNAVLRGGGCRR